MAEALLRPHLGAEAAISSRRSARSDEHYPATPHAVEVLAERGIDLGAH